MRTSTLPRNTTLYNLGKTNTFRASSTSLFSGSYFDEGVGEIGTNLQNIEASVRRIYIPDADYEFTQSDQDGAEARIVAYLTKPALYRELFLNNIKVHVYVALHMFKQKWKDKYPSLDINGACELSVMRLKEHDQWKDINKAIKESDKWPPAFRYYYLAKQTCHSANYGIKAPTFRLNILDKSGGKIVLSRQESEYFLSFYRTMFPEIPAWNFETMEIVSKTRTLYNLFGHPRYFGGEMNNHFFLEANAFVPQSTVGEITHMAIRDCQMQIENEDRPWDVLQNNHDSLLVQHPKKDREEVYKMIEKNLNRKLISPRGDIFFMRSEIKSGMNWSFSE